MRDTYLTRLGSIRSETMTPSEYIDSINPKFKDKFLARRGTYQLDEEVAQRLENVASRYTVVAFSAEWCKDCAANIPVLDLISKATKMRVGILGHLKSDPLNPSRLWAVPPSPPEAETFHVTKIPLILVFDEKGNEVGRVVENPREGVRLEEEILNIIQLLEERR